MTKRGSVEDTENDDSVPLPIQTFLWRQTSPFIRPKFGKLHEASCMEQREACKSFEKVLVQNIQFGLSPSLTEAIKSISRWRLVKASFPHVMHCCAALLYRRKDRCFDKLGTAETKLLYTLQWIILDATEECADDEGERGIYHSSNHYLFPVSAIQVFIYLFAPLSDFLKHTDFMSSFRLENGLKLWEALWEFRHPNVPCFTTPVMPNQNFLDAKKAKHSTLKKNDPFTVTEALQKSSTRKQVSLEERATSFGSSDTSPALTVTSPASSGSTTSPKEDEAESGKSNSKINNKAGKLVCELCTTVPSRTEEAGNTFRCKCGNITVSDQDDSKTKSTQNIPTRPTSVPTKCGTLTDITLATYLDVAALRCLFIAQWLEEGIFWALKFLFKRLNDIKQSISEEPYQRKRSCSLPIPEIEISLYQSPEQKRKECSSNSQQQMESIFLVDASYQPPSHHTSMHELRHSSLEGPGEKKSKWMKVGELKHFVEEKFRLSERLLDKIGKEESHGSSFSEEPATLMHSETSNTPLKFEATLSSDGSEVQRPKSALAMLDHNHSDDTDPSDIKIEMVRGRSMPSLHINGEQLKCELVVPPVMHHDPASLNMKKLPAFHTFSVPNPIITVTEHSPVASVQFFLNQEDETPGEESPLTTPLPRQFMISRSQTDSNITYAGDVTCEAEGSSHYITIDGQIDLLVVLKAIHFVSMGSSTCSLRVCEMALNLLDLLLAFDIFPSLDKETDLGNEKLDDGVIGTPATDTSYQTQTQRTRSMTDRKKEELSEHHLFMDSLIRIYKHLGCPHGCGEGHRSPAADLLRAQMLNTLNRLHEVDKKQFRFFLRDMVAHRALPEIADFFHAFVGFCQDPSMVISPLAQKRTSTSGSQENTSRNTYGNNFGAGFDNNGMKGAEGVVIGHSFKPLVTRLVIMRKELKQQENMSLYCDIRQLMSYVRDNHGGLFRRVLFSGLLDSAERPFRKHKNTIPTTRIVRHTKSVDHEEYRDSIYSPTVFVIDESAMGKSSRKSFFRKRGVRKAASAQNIADEKDDIASCPSPSPGQPFLRYDKAISPRLSVSEDENLCLQQTPKHKAARFPIMNWFKGERGKPGEYPDEDGYSPPHGLVEGFSLPEKLSRGTSMINRTPKLNIKTTSQVSVTLSRARKRMEDHFNKFGFGRSKNKHGSFEEPLDISRRNSCDFEHGLKEGEFLVTKESKIVNVIAVRDGMQRFSFLLEACNAGTVPDAIFLAAALTLKAPVVARAALYLECAHFVHRCNKGCWPSWMKLNLPVFRPSGPMAHRGTQVALRRSPLLQKAAGRMFYQWAEAIGRRLDELMEEEQSNLTSTAVNESDENKKRQLRLEDEEEDFLDEACVNPNGSDCPAALKVAACQLLLEITAFIRETFSCLPHKTSRTSCREKHPFEPRSMTANRRWSMALSSLGFSQNSAHSIVSLSEQMHPAPPGERRISFFLHDADIDGESENSSNTTIAIQEDDDKRGKKVGQGRSHLLRRGLGSSTSHSSSFKRRSIKLKKPGDRRSRARSSTFAEDEEDLVMKRTDSVRSRRKVSAVSDRSDTSERADVSGEESPGVLSDDQPPESPIDVQESDDSTLTKHLPWLKTAVQVTGSFNFTCTHQYFCQTNCYRRQMRSCNRLIKAVRKVYGEYFGTSFDEEKQHDDKNDIKKEKKIKKIITAPSSPLRRKTSIAHNLDKLERPSDVPHLGAFRSLHSSTTFLAHDIEAGAHADKVEPKPPPTNQKGKKKGNDELPVLKYIRSQVKNLFHCMLSTAIKGAVVMPEENFVDILSIAWELLLETDQQLTSAAAVAFILASVKSPEPAAELLKRELKSENAAQRINAVLKFQILWKSRYQCWPRMEEGAHVNFKIPPPVIEFTLPSPKIAQDGAPVADTPWMPHVKAKVEEVTISQDQARSFVTATKTRRKQQMELIHKALQDEVEKKRSERENYHITTVAITAQAAYEPALFHSIDEHEEGDEDLPLERTTAHHMQAAQALFPSCLCSAAIPIIHLLEDSQVNSDGIAVYEAALKVTWTCLVEDTALFLRNILEKLTRDKQPEMFQILRKLLRFVPHLPAQSAYTLYNYLIGYVMFYMRTPADTSQDNVGNALSVLWQVVPSVHGLFLKDLKQILRKEQCDAALLITANIPSAKKIIIHGPDATGIPSQYPIHEDTQFSLILQDSLDFFAIEESQQSSYFLVDTKSNQMHNPDWFVRDFYFFKRSQYPQLSLIYMEEESAYELMQKQALQLKFLELGKVLMSFAILKSNTQIAQRVFFIHEELMKLPSFPRKALEAEFGLYAGIMGKEMLAMDTLHKMVWVKLIARMFEAMAGMFVHSSDIHLFLNVVNGALVLHAEDAAMLRLCMSTFLNAAHQFKNIFASNGYLLIMPTMLRIYSNHQTNNLLCRTIEFVCKQFYIMHRKPFILQMFGSAAPILDMDTLSAYGDANKVQQKAFFQLLQSLEQYVVDPLDILELVDAEKPLKALDFCYQMDPDILTILDAISLCVTVVAYAADSHRGHQMLTILEAILPFYLKHLQNLTMKKETPGGSRTELSVIHSISICMKTLVNNCEALARNYTGPQRSIDLRGSSIKNISRGAYSPPFEVDDDSQSKFMSDSYYSSRKQQHQQQYDRQIEDSEILRMEFRRPRDTLLYVVSEFLTTCSSRLADLSKKIPDLTSKATELLDVKCHLRLAEVAHSLLKVSPYDPMTMSCRGLQRYMNQVLPHSEWAQEAMRPALIMVLRRIDKTFNKIAKKPNIRRLVDWNAARSLLKGVYMTLYRHPYIAHLPHLKSLVSVCQSLLLGDHSACAESTTNLASSSTSLRQAPPPSFCSVVVRLIAMQIVALGDTQSLESVCGGSNAFSSPEKVEIYLMNLILPLCIRICSGVKDVPKLRHSDITFGLNMVLHAIAPIPTRQNHQAPAGGKSGNDRDLPDKQPSRSKMFLFHIGFVGLKILIVCFEKQLGADWHRIASCLRELGIRMQGGLALWNFIDFIVTHRTPLYILLYPMIRCKVLQIICDNEQEYHYQQQIKGKLHGSLLPIAKSRGGLFADMITELKSLKEDLISWRIGGGKIQRLKSTMSAERSNSDTSQPATYGQAASTARRHSSFTENSGGRPRTARLASLTESMKIDHEFASEENPVQAKRSLKHYKGLSIRFNPRLGSRRALKQLLRRSSYPYPEDEGTSSRDAFSSCAPAAASEPRLWRKSTAQMKRGSKKSTAAAAEGGTSHSSLGTDDQQRLHDPSTDQDTSSQPPSCPTSPIGSVQSPDSEPHLPRHRLQRQGAPSRKTFRYRKSHRGAGWATHAEAEDLAGETIAMIPTKIQPILKEEDGASAPLEVTFLPKHKSTSVASATIEVAQSPVERRAARRHQKKRFRSHSESPTSPEEQMSPAPLSPNEGLTTGCESTESLSYSEKSTLLKDEDVTSERQLLSSSLMIYPNQNEDDTCV